MLIAPLALQQLPIEDLNVSLDLFFAEVHLSIGVHSDQWASLEVLVVLVKVISHVGFAIDEERLLVLNFEPVDPNGGNEVVNCVESEDGDNA